MKKGIKGKVWFLKKFSLFDGLSDEEVSVMAKFLEEKEVEKMKILFEPEDEEKVFFIKRGMVEVYQLTPDGKKIVLETLGSGSFFGAVGAGLPQQNFLEAAEHTYLCVTTRERLFEMMAEEPKLAKQLVDGLFEQLFEAREQIAVLATGSVREKLIHLLKLLARKYGVDKVGRTLIAARFTHEEMANMIGSSRETVTKTLSELEKDGLIERNGKQILVLKRLLVEEELV